jgi:hypothetical protein
MNDFNFIQELLYNESFEVTKQVKDLQGTWSDSVCESLGEVLWEKYVPFFVHEDNSPRFIRKVMRRIHKIIKRDLNIKL